MQKISKKIVLVIVTIFLIIICNNFSFAVSTVTDRANSNTSQNSSSEQQENEINNTENATTNELSENEIIEEHMELNYPDIKETDNTFGPLTTEQIIGGSAALMALVGIILAISLYARSRENEEDDWNYEEENIETPSEREEPKAMKELKKEPIFFRRNRVFRVYSGGKLFHDFFGDKAEDAETLAGLILDIKEDFPKVKEQIDYGRCSFLVLELDKRRIGKVKVKIDPAKTEE